MDEIIVELLSAGVIASLIAGIFSLVISIKNNKRLVELESRKQRFTIAQERLKGLREAYNDWLNLLPTEKHLGFFIMNLPAQEGFQENGLSESYRVAEENIKIIHSHFEKYCYLFNSRDQSKINNMFNALDSITQSIINENRRHNLDSQNEEENLSVNLNQLITDRIMKVVEFEELYFNLLKTNLSKISDWEDDT